MVDSSPLARLLDRAGKVFGLARSLAWDLEQDHKSQGPVVMADVQPAWQQHGERIKEFVEATLGVRDIVQNPPDGLVDVVKQLCEAGRLAKRLTRRAYDSETNYHFGVLELWPDLNTVAQDGHEAIKAARKAARLDDPFAAFDEPKPTEASGTEDSHATTDASTVTADAPRRKQKRSTEKGEGRAKLIAALTKHHKYADGGCLNLEPIGNNELAAHAGVSPSTASAFFNKEFDGHTKYRAACGDATRLVAALKLLNLEFAPYHLFGAKPPGEDEREDDE